MTTTTHPLVGTITTRTNERTGDQRHWLCKAASGLVIQTDIEEAITMASVTGSVGATAQHSDEWGSRSVTVVELVERQAGA